MGERTGCARTAPSGGLLGRVPLAVGVSIRTRPNAIWKTAGVQYDHTTTVVTFNNPIEAQVHRESSGTPMGLQLGFSGTHAVCLEYSSPMTTTGECDNLDCSQRTSQQVRTQSRNYGLGSRPP